MIDYDEAVLAYNEVKENIRYALPSRWGSVYSITKHHKGQCGMKCEVLIDKLRRKSIPCRFVEGRLMLGKPPIFSLWLILKLGLVLFDAHVWVEAFIDGNWLVLDPSPDSGIAHCFGDTIPGTHLGHPQYIHRMTKIPEWYKKEYEMRLFQPLRVMINTELVIRRWLKK